MDYDKDNIEFLTVSGHYQPAPIDLQHTWNRAKTCEGACGVLREAWNLFKNKNTLVPNSKGVINEFVVTPGTLQQKVKTFRKKGVYMKELPKGFGGKHDWAPVIAASMQYKPTQSKSRFKF